jgi:hypothetical protein
MELQAVGLEACADADAGPEEASFARGAIYGSGISALLWLAIAAAWLLSGGLHSR